MITAEEVKNRLDGERNSNFDLVVSRINERLSRETSFPTYIHYIKLSRQDIRKLQKYYENAGWKIKRHLDPKVNLLINIIYQLATPKETIDQYVLEFDFPSVSLKLWRLLKNKIYSFFTKKSQLALKNSIYRD